MNKIKIVGGLVFGLIIVLAFLSNHITTQNRLNSDYLNRINKQKALAQEVTQSILYGYKNRDSSSNKMQKSIESFLKNRNSKSENKYWNRFYKEIENFQKQQKVTIVYGSIVTEKNVNTIYNINMKLIVEFNRLLETWQLNYHTDIAIYKKIQYILFFILVSLLIYLFTQVREIILFIQKFSKTSKNIIENSTIQGLEPMKEIEQIELSGATKNYNHMVEKINNSIKRSTLSIEHTTKSLEEVEQNIEEFIKLLSAMQNSESDELLKREDAVIDSLETLMKLKETLVDLKMDLDGLVKR
jgi:methyl-accepting chemotaxis protein